jgi:SAM-dependent methyltransferase
MLPTDISPPNSFFRAIEMGRMYPNASVTGLDLAPNYPDRRELPSNVHFEVYDINKGLEHLSNIYDLVHMRSAVGGIHDAEKTMMQASLCLKPGGLILFIEGDPDICAEDKLHTVNFPDSARGGTDREASWFRKIIYGRSPIMPEFFKGTILQQADTSHRSGSSQ